MIIGLALIALVVIVSCVFAFWRSRTDGVFAANDASQDSMKLTEDQLGAPLGNRATLLEFTSAFCAPCRATRQVLDRVANDVDGVAVIEVDAEHQLDLTRSLSVLRTPTVFVLDADGVVRHRASGQPRYADVAASLGTVIR